jgi:uncharacterized membrane protein YphA (DoxX/SURF4 family)
MSIELADTPNAADATRWSLQRRVAFRLAFVYVGVYLLTEWLFAIPGLKLAAGIYEKCWQAVELWTGVHVLHLTGPIDLHTLGTGSGDTLLDYLQLICQLTFAAAVALVWTIADAKRRSYDALHQWLRVYIRYSLAMIMLSYGMAKVFPGQFGYPTLDRLLEAYGQSSPMGLLWTFMGYSRPYAFFTGLVECTGGLLLFSQRTTTLGALVVAAAMGNVAMLNFAYDVPVKLYSSHLLLLAVVLIAPDVSRLVAVFVANRPTAPAPTRKPFTTVWRNRTALTLKAIVIVGSLWHTAGRFIARSRQPPSARAPRYGIYDVVSFVVNGEPRPPASMDAVRWRRVIVTETGGLSVQTMDDAMTRYRAKDDAARRTYELSTIFSPYDKIVLAYTEPSAGDLNLEGNYRGEAIAVRLRKAPMPTFLLNQRGFHWISEYPYNR